MESSVPSSNDPASSQRATRFYKDLLRDVASLPGVVAVGASRATPGYTASDGGYGWITCRPWTN